MIQKTKKEKSSFGRAHEDKSNDSSHSTDYAYACSSKITNQPIDYSYAYVTTDSVSKPQRDNESETNNENEGWEDNKIYVTENDVEVKVSQEGWEDNVIYADSDKGTEVKGQNDDEQGQNDNVVSITN